MEMHQLRYFAKVAALGSFTRAAAACFVSQPSLSQQIQKLEGELGRPLFDRLGRSVRLTEAGEALLARVLPALAMLEDARARIKDEPDQGRLTIAAIPTIAPYLLPRIIRDFSRTFPRAELEVVEDVTAGILRRAAEGELDLALVALPIQAEGVVVEPLFTEELHLVVPAGHALAARTKVSLADLAQEPFVLLGDAHCLTGNALNFCHRKGFQPVTTARLHQLATALELVSLGLGVSLVPEMARRGDGAPGRVYLPLAGERPTRTIALLRPEGRFESKLERRFVDWLRARYAPATAPARRPPRRSR